MDGYMHKTKTNIASLEKTEILEMKSLCRKKLGYNLCILFKG